MDNNGDHDGEVDEGTEHTALIVDGQRANVSGGERPSIGSVHAAKARSSTAILNILCAIVFIAACANGFANIPLTRIVEDTVCRQHYSQDQGYEHPIDEKLCKLEAIQSKMAFIFALTGMCEAIIGFLAAFPWGIAADRIGRKPVFSIALIGMALGMLFMMTVLWFRDAFSTIFIALGSAFLLIGGGNAVVVGVLLSIISDAVPDNQRATAFMRLHVSGLVGGQISPALSSAMVAATGPWPVMLLAVSCLVTGAIAVLFIPGTLQHEGGSEESESEDSPSSFKERLVHTLSRFKESLSILKSPSLILLMVTSLVTTPFTFGLLQFLVQFVSKRYDVLIKYTGYIQTAYGLVHTIQALLILPWISELLLKDRTPKPFKMVNEQDRDLTLARWSFWFLLLGFLLLGAAPSIGVFILGLLILAIGSGYNSLIRSLMSLYVAPAYQSRLFSLVGMVEVLGSIYGSPMMAGLFTLGLRLGGGWIGLPYYGLAVLCALCIGVLVFVKVPKHLAIYAPL